MGTILLTEEQIRESAEAHGVDYPALRAVCQVESGGMGYLDDGRIKILFERHVMWDRLKERRIDPSILGKDRPDLCGPKWEPKKYPYGTSKNQYLRIAAIVVWAAKHDQAHWESYKKAAYEASSWGMFQQMGYHFQGLGFANIYEFKHFLEASEQNQLDTILRWMVPNGLMRHLQRHEWEQFVTGYNGKGRVEAYTKKLVAAYKQFGGK